VLIRCCRNVFTALLPCNGHLFLFHYSGFQPSCYIVPSLGCSSQVAYRSITISSPPRGHACGICYCVHEQQAPPCHAGPDASASGLDSLQPSFLVGWVLHCFSRAAPSIGLLILSGSLVRCYLVQVYYQHLRSEVSLNPVHHIIDSGDYPVWALPWGLRLAWLPFSVGWATRPHSVVLLVARWVGKMVAVHFHSVTGQLQTLVGVIVGVM
jgi:hypothetical protein